MEYFLLVDEFDRGQDAGDEELGLILRKLMAKSYLVPEVSARQKIHDQV